MNSHEHDHSEAPLALRDALRQSPGDVPGSALEDLDRAVLGHAHARLTAQRAPRPHRFMLRIGVPLAAAAGLALGATIALWPTPQAPVNTGTGTIADAMADDAAGFDVVDVYAVALDLRRGDAADAMWDRDGDNAVASADLDLLMQELVRLEGM